MIGRSRSRARRATPKPPASVPAAALVTETGSPLVTETGQNIVTE